MILLSFFRDYSKPNNFYIFNHVDIQVSYHSGQTEEWGKFLDSGEAGGRIVCEYYIVQQKRIHSRRV